MLCAIFLVSERVADIQVLQGITENILQQTFLKYNLTIDIKTK